MMLLIPPLAAETIFHFGNFPITNSYVNSSLALAGFAVFALFLNLGRKRFFTSKGAPRGLLNFFESIVELMLGYVDQVTGDRKKSLKFLPIVGSLFLFIVISNWMGLLPGTGSIGVWQMHHGKLELIPLFRPANTDLNMTAAMAVLAVASSHILGVAAIGFFKYANRFIKLGDLFSAVISLRPVNILVAVVEFFVGLIEIFSEVAKMISLSLRLYGNIFAGEVLLTVIASLIISLANAIPGRVVGWVTVPMVLPFMAMEVIVGLIQGVVFSMLTLVYLNMATTETSGHGSHEAGEQEKQPAPSV